MTGPIRPTEARPRIGRLILESPFVLAPMAGYTRLPFRMLCRRYHCGLVFTEVTTSEGIRRQSAQSLHYLESTPAERPIAAHIYGSNPAVMAQAARTIEALQRFDLIDINCGCPVPKVTRSGAGVALMRSPKKVQQIVDAVSSAVSLPVTIKTRLGLSPDLPNISEVAQAAEEGGASAIFIHARFASDVHSGPPHLEALARVKAERSIPVFGNGGVTCAAHAITMMCETGIDGVMIGRGALGNPWIFAECHALLAGGLYQAPNLAERRAVIVEHLHCLHELMLMENEFRRRRNHTAEQATCRKFRGHLMEYLAGMQGLSALRRELMTLDSLDALVSAIDRVLACNPDTP
ncbi:MAG: tRNA dihydrouridine synthase DusB [Chloroflexi bacterium]|nr:tRNA dihydrouridine synthase DusB [Chloroflexota bacterium]